MADAQPGLQMFVKDKQRFNECQKEQEGRGCPPFPGRDDWLGAKPGVVGTVKLDNSRQ